MLREITVTFSGDAEMTVDDKICSLHGKFTDEEMRLIAAMHDTMRVWFQEEAKRDD